MQEIQFEQSHQDLEMTLNDENIQMDQQQDYANGQEITREDLMDEGQDQEYGPEEENELVEHEDLEDIDDQSVMQSQYYQDRNDMTAQSQICYDQHDDYTDGIDEDELNERQIHHQDEDDEQEFSNDRTHDFTVGDRDACSQGSQQVEEIVDDRQIGHQNYVENDDDYGAEVEEQAHLAKQHQNQNNFEANYDKDENEYQEEDIQDDGLNQEHSNTAGENPNFREGDLDGQGEEDGAEFHEEVRDDRPYQELSEDVFDFKIS